MAENKETTLSTFILILDSRDIFFKSSNYLFISILKFFLMSLHIEKLRFTLQLVTVNVTNNFKTKYKFGKILHSLVKQNNLNKSLVLVESLLIIATEFSTISSS